MELQQAKADLIKLQDKTSAYAHAMGLMNFDGETIAPSGTSANRAHAMGILSEEMYKMATGEETVKLLEFLDSNNDELDLREKRMVFLLLKDLRFMEKIPMEEYIAYQQLLVESEDAWRKAKVKNDFKSFAPYLEKVYETVRKFASYVKPEMDPYDFWLNEYEDGLDMATCDKFFSEIKEGLVPLLKRISEKPQVDDSCLKGNFSDAKQEEFALYLMDIIGLDKEHVGLATTEHPFTTSLGSHFDERITTHFQSDNVASSLYSVVHEGGHALYDTGSEDSLAYTVLDGGVSMGIHESQSRFYENILGRSRAFIELIYPKLVELFPENFSDVSVEDVYKAVNKVEPSLIRTEADEATYSLHIMVRYELEKKLLHGELEVKGLPQEWNRMYKEYLGIDVPDDAHGVLQDTHWGSGLVGYFPSYALGSAYGAQFFNKMKESVDVDTAIKNGDFRSINDWNREHIWKHGSLYTPQEILDMVYEEPFNPKHYLNYLENKFTEIYNL